MTALPEWLRIKASVAAADDARILQIVALVDAMPERGEADALVAPLRPRLAKLRPPRPASFTRLLFTPLDSLIVPNTNWRRGTLSIPRSALLPIAGALRQDLANEAERIDAAGRAGPVPQAQLNILAAAIWPAAAAALDNLALPPDWNAAAGLPAADFRTIASLTAAVLGVGLEIQTLVQAGGAPAEDPLRTILGRTAPRGGEALGAVMAVLLARFPASGLIMTLGTEASGSAPSKAVDTAIDYTIDRIQAALTRMRRSVRPSRRPRQTPGTSPPCWTISAAPGPHARSASARRTACAGLPI